MVVEREHQQKDTDDLLSLSHLLFKDEDAAESGLV